MTGEAAGLSNGELVAGKLRVIRLLGTGGMGAVYEVEHELTRHRRALKLLQPAVARNTDAVARFLREASAAGRIGSEHIVETFDAGVLDSGEPYLVMELLDGQSLAEILEQRGRLPEQTARHWLAEACDGAQAAHDAGIVHRDIKPDNLFIERSGRVKLMDFGISKFDPALTGELQLTRDDLTLGTPYYMAPEQTLQANRVDERTDVYALGVVLYEALTGAKPFTAHSFPQLVLKIHEGSYAPASSVAPSSTLLDRIIARAMARDPDARFSSARELARALRDLEQPTERAPTPLVEDDGRAFRPSFAATLLAPAGRPARRAPSVSPHAWTADAADAKAHALHVAVAPGALAHEPTLISLEAEPLRSARSASRARARARWLLIAISISGASVGWVWQSRSTSRPAVGPLAGVATVPRSALALTPSALPSAPVRSADLQPVPPTSSARKGPGPPPIAASREKSTNRATQHQLDQANPFE